MKPEDFEKFKIIALQVFNGAAGRGSLNNKDYPSAQKYFQAALETELRMDPNDPGQLQNVYPLAIAYLTPKPINVVGLWYIARAVALSQGAAQTEIAKYGKAKYYYYHRSEEHTSELQSHLNLVCRLLLEKKKLLQTQTHYKQSHPQCSLSTR